MANDRNLIRYEEGNLFVKTKEDILRMLYDNLSAIYGAEIDMSPESFQRRELYFFAELLDSVTDTMYNIERSFELNSARGIHLENLIYFVSGLKRMENNTTKISPLTVRLPAGIIHPNELTNSRWVLTDLDGIAWISSGEIEPIEDEDDDTEIYQFEAECDNFGPHTITAGTTFKHLYVDGTYKTDDILIDPDNLPIVGRLGGYEENDTAFMNRYRELIAEGSLTLSESIMTTLRKEMPGVIKDSMVINSTESEGTVLEVKGLTATNEPITRTVTVLQHDILIILQPHLGVNLGGESTSQAIAKMLQRLITVGISTMRKTGSGFADDPSYIMKELPAHSEYAGIKEYVRYKIATRHDPKITINLKAGINYAALDPGAKAALEKHIKDAIKQLSLKYIINQPINMTELRTAVESYDRVPNAYVIDDDAIGGGISIVGGTDVKYGYWYIEDTNNSITIEWDE